jgi:hypothetical protein
MRIATRSASQIILTSMVVALAASYYFSPDRMEAQGGQGQNAVCTTQPCSPTVGTKAFIDASMFANTTICSTIYNILLPASYAATVIDARGLNPGNTSMTCGAGAAGGPLKPSFGLSGAVPRRTGRPGVLAIDESFPHAMLADTFSFPGRD